MDGEEERGGKQSECPILSSRSKVPALKGQCHETYSYTVPEAGEDEDGEEEGEEGDGVSHQLQAAAGVQHPHLQLPRFLCNKVSCYYT